MGLIPTMLVRKPGGPVTRINVSDFEPMQRGGYVEYVVGSEKDNPAPAGVAAGEAAAKPTIKELRDKAAKLGVVNASKLKEDELLKIIVESQPQEP